MDKMDEYGEKIILKYNNMKHRYMRERREIFQNVERDRKEKHQDY